MISVCFRFDDPSALSDHALERRIFEVFSRFEVPLCVAAIPFACTRSGEPVPLTSHNAPHLIEASQRGVIEVAQHGHSHLPRSQDNKGGRSEFAGLEAAEQARLIQEGRQHPSALFGHAIRGFVPPWNTYDSTTARVLEEAGFEFLSAGWDFHRAGALPIVPRTCSLRDARCAIEGALAFRSLAPVLVVVMHPDDFKEFRLPPLPDEPPPFTSLPELESLLGWLQSQRHVDTPALGTIAESVRDGTALSNPRELKLPFRIRTLLPPMLARSNGWRMLPVILWGALQTRYGSGG
ncbi:MAG TPA: DUF2334 domain-containing protein, partial [Casimicrobiaceae bacterium]|nr:DUF2334 domain-containing protein [Casimicrobiaceae bacterium]